MRSTLTETHSSIGKVKVKMWNVGGGKTEKGGEMWATTRYRDED